MLDSRNDVIPRSTQERFSTTLTSPCPLADSQHVGAWGDSTYISAHSRHSELQNIIDKKHTVYPKKYAHAFVVLCFVVVMQSFIMNSYEVFIHIHQGWFAGTGAIVRLPQCQWSKPDGYGKISQCITTTKHSKQKPCAYFLGYTVLDSNARSLFSEDICRTKYDFNLASFRHREVPLFTLVSYAHFKDNIIPSA